jgi:hypothetical protein
MGEFGDQQPLPAAFLAAALPLHELPAEPDGMAEALAAWTLARLDYLSAVLPDLASGGWAA